MSSMNHDWPKSRVVKLDALEALSEASAHTDQNQSDAPLDQQAKPTTQAKPQALGEQGAKALTRRPGRSPFLDRRQILEATSACLQAGGYEGTTIRAIAKRLGCAIGSIYRYCADKDELLMAVCEGRFETLLDEASTQSVQETTELYRGIALANRCEYGLMFWLASSRGDQGRGGGGLPEVVERLLAIWTEKLGDATEAKSTWAGLHGSILLGETVTVSRDAVDVKGLSTSSSQVNSDIESKSTHLDEVGDSAVGNETLMDGQSVEDEPVAEDLTLL